MKNVDTSSKGTTPGEDARRRIDEFTTESAKLYGVDAKAALDFARQAEKLAREIEYMPGLANALMRGAVALIQKSAPHDSLQMTLEALEIFVSLGDKLGEAQALGKLSSIYFIIGDLRQSLAYIRRSLSISQEYDYQIGIVGAYNRLGILMHALGNRAEAIEFLHKSLDYCEESQDSENQLLLMNNLANIYKEIGDKKKALQYFHNCRAAYHSNGNHLAEASVLLNIGNCYTEGTANDEALKFFTEGLNIFRSVGNRRKEALALNNIGSYYYKNANYELALRMYKECLTIAQECEDRYSEMHALNGMGGCLAHLTRYDEADIALYKAIDCLPQSKGTRLHADIYKTFTVLYELQGAHVNALKYHKLYHAEIQRQFNEKADERVRNLQILHDVEQARKETEIHRLEKIELAQANVRLEELVRANNEFLGIAAHDLKNPIANIKALAALVAQQANTLEPDETADICADIETSAQRLLALVANLLDINRIDQGRLNIVSAPFDLDALTQRYLNVYVERARKKNIRLHFHDAGSGVHAYADRDITVQILDNLISNAVKYSPPDSDVTIRVSSSEGESGRYARLEVSDQGPGISQEELPRLFQKFAKLSPQPTAGEDSTGLGLSIVKRLVEAMHGRVWCESALGMGATFTVEFPSQSRSSSDSSLTD